MREVGSALGVGTECGLYYMDAGGLWRAHGARAGAGGTLTNGWTNSAFGGPGRRSTPGGGSCTTPLMVCSGGTSPGRAGELLWSFCPSLCNDTCRSGFFAEHESLFMRQSTVALGRISAFLARAVHTWKYGAFFRRVSYLAVTRPVSGCCMRNTENEFSDDSVVIRVMLGSTVNTCSASV